MTGVITLSFLEWTALGLFNCAVAYYLGYRHGRRKRNNGTHGAQVSNQTPPARQS